MASKRLQKKKATAAARLETKKAAAIKIETTQAEEPRLTASSQEEFIYQQRFHCFYGELKWLYCELYKDHPRLTEALLSLTENMRDSYKKRCTLSQVDSHPWADQSLLAMMTGYTDDLYDRLSYFEELGVNCLYLTSLSENFSSFASACIQHNINLCASFLPKHLKEDPEAFNHTVSHILSLANQGIRVLHMDRVLEDRPEVHSVVRMLRLVFEIVCPEVLLLGNGASYDDASLSFFGTEEHPEFHIMTSPENMAGIWHTAATRDTALLRHNLDKRASLPRHYLFLNFLRDQNPVCWNLDYDYLSGFSIGEAPHRKYLNDFFTGRFPDSYARGEQLSSDLHEGICGTTASFCGIERFDFEGNYDRREKAVRLHNMLHAFVMSQSGIPAIYSGDEIGQLNDYSYKQDPAKAFDPQNLHRGGFESSLAENRTMAETVQGKIFSCLSSLEELRRSHSIFAPAVPMHTIDTWDSSLLAFVRENAEEKFIGIYNFSESDRVAWINEEDGLYEDLLSGSEIEAKGLMVPAFDFFWLLRKKTEK